MSKSSSNSARDSQSSSPHCGRENTPDDSDAEKRSDYYYDDATGYEVYEDEEEENDETSEE
ncbi:MAG TPA: hypothetical protein VIF81_11670 [Pyrinomonadaceae bacterium]|jgi:hypothetical protein|nr:hypothetical protein [Pyrinomonadaceae bacterium]